LQEAITRPALAARRTWGEESTTLKLEDRSIPRSIAALRKAGHDVELMPAFTSVMGHAGAIVRHADGMLEGATDPRSDGQVAAW
jgi:gamma-glutamyltranspeptidase